MADEEKLPPWLDDLRKQGMTPGEIERTARRERIREPKECHRCGVLIRVGEGCVRKPWSNNAWHPECWLTRGR